MLKKLAGHFVGMKIKTNFKLSPVIPFELLFTLTKLSPVLRCMGFGYI